MTHLSMVTYVSKEFETLVQFSLGSSSHGTRGCERKMSGLRSTTQQCAVVQVLLFHNSKSLKLKQSLNKVRDSLGGVQVCNSLLTLTLTGRSVGLQISVHLTCFTFIDPQESLPLKPHSHKTWQRSEFRIHRDLNRLQLTRTFPSSTGNGRAVGFNT